MGRTARRMALISKLLPATLLCIVVPATAAPTERRFLQNLDGWEEKCLPYCLGERFEVDGLPSGISALWGEAGRCNAEFHSSLIITDVDPYEDCPMNCHMVCCMASGVEDLSHCDSPTWCIYQHCRGEMPFWQTDGLEATFYPNTVWSSASGREGF